jgi:alanyl-tRNA synthetase
MMDSGTVRQHFLDFFKGKGHLIVPSAPLVLKNDPSLLFTNSGMVQFKDVFLGNSVAKSKRIADTQKCLRVSGKHNDLEDVGHDTYHHTLFEMLGNWSFGDYFKKEAIAWAWELLTEVYHLPKDRLYVTVFGGDTADGLEVDQEAKDFWRSFVSDDRILHGSKKDNFWEMGESGPCGPCSEIHIDLRPEKEVGEKPGRDLVNRDHPQVVEIWNLVFIQFNRLASGELEALPEKHVDTGMGFERLCMAIQHKTSTYDTDVFRPLIDFIAVNANLRYGEKEQTDVALRVMADHLRAVSLTIADGQLPSNSGAGYVIRRILRRAVRYGFSYLNFKEPFLYRLVPLLAIQFKNVFPELHRQEDYVVRVVQEEELAFLRTLEAGLQILDKWVADADTATINGENVFVLYDTFGFPKDLTLLILRERGLQGRLNTRWDVEFNAAMEKQKMRSKTDATKETGDWVVLQEGKSEFVGYDQLSVPARITKYRKVKQKNQELVQLVLDKTPFYAESGGQVGDRGVLESANEKIVVTDTRKENDLIIHFVQTLPQSIGVPFQASVDPTLRRRTMNNHSATHLLHATLREILGKHVEQKGSLVNEKMLRFDFSHFAAMTAAEIRKVEDRVNEKIRQNISLLEQRQVPIEKAKSLGAMALFGEKYGDFVRVITFDPKFSVELCGGTHVPATGQIGLFKIVSESSVAAGVRRIEAVTADGAEEFVHDELARLDEIRTLFKNPSDVAAAAQHLFEEKHALEKKLGALYQEQAMALKDRLASAAVRSNGSTRIIAQLAAPHAETVKNIAYALRHQFPDLFLVLAADVEGKPLVTVMIGEQLVGKTTLHAGNIVRELAKEIDGGGGGQSFFATAGGKNLNGLEAVIKKAKLIVSP